MSHLDLVLSDRLPLSDAEIAAIPRDANPLLDVGTAARWATTIHALADDNERLRTEQSFLDGSGHTLAEFLEQRDRMADALRDAGALLALANAMLEERTVLLRAVETWAPSLSSPEFRSVLKAIRTIVADPSAER